MGPPEMTEMEAEFSELVSRVGSGAMTKNPENAEARKIFVEKIGATQNERQIRERERSERAASRAMSRAASRAGSLSRAGSRAGGYSGSRLGSRGDSDPIQRAASRQSTLKVKRDISINLAEASPAKETSPKVRKQLSSKKTSDFLALPQQDASRNNISIKPLRTEKPIKSPDKMIVAKDLDRKKSPERVTGSKPIKISQKKPTD